MKSKLERIRTAAVKCVAADCEGCPYEDNEYCLTILFRDIAELCNELIAKEDDGR